MGFVVVPAPFTNFISLHVSSVLPELARSIENPLLFDSLTVLQFSCTLFLFTDERKEANSTGNGVVLDVCESSVNRSTAAKFVAKAEGAFLKLSNLPAVKNPDAALSIVMFAVPLALSTSHFNWQTSLYVFVTTKPLSGSPEPISSSGVLHPLEFIAADSANGEIRYALSEPTAVFWRIDELYPFAIVVPVNTIPRFAVLRLLILAKLEADQRTLIVP